VIDYYYFIYCRGLINFVKFGYQGKRQKAKGKRQKAIGIRHKASVKE
jgi:hypothetical protein